jgi:hypothetical protein
VTPQKIFVISLFAFLIIFHDIHFNWAGMGKHPVEGKKAKEKKQEKQGSFQGSLLSIHHFG